MKQTLTGSEVRLVISSNGANLNLTDEEDASLLSHLRPGVPSRIPPPLPGISHRAALRKTTEGRSGLRKHHDYDGESHCARPCG